jgi:hypothetical protein
MNVTLAMKVSRLSMATVCHLNVTLTVLLAMAKLNSTALSVPLVLILSPAAKTEANRFASVWKVWIPFLWLHSDALLLCVTQLAPHAMEEQMINAKHALRMLMQGRMATEWAANAQMALCSTRISVRNAMAHARPAKELTTMSVLHAQLAIKKLLPNWSMVTVWNVIAVVKTAVQMAHMLAQHAIFHLYLLQIHMVSHASVLLDTVESAAKTTSATPHARPAMVPSPTSA